MTNMTNKKKVYDENGKPGVIETNDFSYYTQLLNQNVPAVFTGDINKLLTLWRDITDFLREIHDVNMCPCETPHLCSKDHDSMDDDWY